MYAPITIDVRELAKAMGYASHHKGGMRPEHLRAVSTALEHLECFWITVKPASAPERGALLERRARVLAIMGKDVQRSLFGESVPLQWRIALGEWAQAFPRAYAYIFRSLVELPAKDGASTWMKLIGTELAYLYRQDQTAEPEASHRRKVVKAITVRALLERASLLDEVLKMRGRNHHARATSRFETVMDRLKDFGVHEEWVYDPKSNTPSQQSEGRPGSFDAWLDTTLLVRAPQHLIEPLPELGASPPHQVAKSRGKKAR